MVEPVNLLDDNGIEGVGVPIQEAHVRSADGLYIQAVLLQPTAKMRSQPIIRGGQCQGRIVP